EVFEVVVSHIQQKGGQVLKFMGDGLLAIFSHDDGGRACTDALHAARAIQAGIDTLAQSRQARGEPATGIGIGLHYGDVMYGNIGAPGRLDFTVIGSAVNLSARIEGLCRGLDRSILMSRNFADLLQEPMESCGTHELKGVDAPVEVLCSS
ncbi:MAG: adenylate/guanylate cyclase domain-containing protein, partial [Myxococcota bacterium]|nr:adenylate/guanylate cyclase domain-containing protein [Myxococcota bacterium]